LSTRRVVGKAAGDECVFIPSEVLGCHGARSSPTGKASQVNLGAQAIIELGWEPVGSILQPNVVSFRRSS